MMTEAEMMASSYSIHLKWQYKERNNENNERRHNGGANNNNLNII